MMPTTMIMVLILVAFRSNISNAKITESEILFLINCVMKLANLAMILTLQ